MLKKLLIRNIVEGTITQTIPQTIWNTHILIFEQNNKTHMFLLQSIQLNACFLILLCSLEENL